MLQLGYLGKEWSVEKKHAIDIPQIYEILGFIASLMNAAMASNRRLSMRASPLPLPCRVSLTADFTSVVAVHGLNFKGSSDHAWKTWTKGDKLWLRDFLPGASSKARSRDALCI